MRVKELNTLSENYSIIFFDGVCNICNGYVNFLIKRDKAFKFKFSPLQSSAGHHISKSLKIEGEPQYIIVLSKRKVYTKSNAIVRILRDLGGFWSIFLILIIVPGVIRNKIYNIIAKNRYAWFGKMDSCMIPSEKDKERFIS